MGDMPNWLNMAFLSSVLKDAVVTKVLARPTAGPGINYYSQLYRVDVYFNESRTSKEEQHIALIIKAPFEQGFVADLKESVFYAKEPNVYSFLFPKMKEKIDCIFGPRSFCCPRKNTLVLEDLSEKGYIMMNKFDQLDFQHCKVVLEMLAKFHATSVVCCSKNPELLSTIAEEEAYRNDGLSVVGTPQWATICMKRFANIVNKMEVKQSTKDLINSKIENIWDIAVNLSRPRTDSLNVLNHGDCWTNNILFKHDSGVVNDVKFIDFQLVRFASPVLDLITFLYSSANREVREHRLQELYCIYLDNLNYTFEKLGCEERLTSKDLQTTMRNCSDWVIIVLSYDIPFFLSSSEDAINFHDSTMDEIEAQLNDMTNTCLHNSLYYKELLPSLMKMFENLLHPE